MSTEDPARDDEYYRGPSTPRDRDHPAERNVAVRRLDRTSTSELEASPAHSPGHAVGSPPSTAAATVGGATARAVAGRPPGGFNSMTPVDEDEDDDDFDDRGSRDAPEYLANPDGRGPVTNDSAGFSSVLVQRDDRTPEHRSTNARADDLHVSSVRGADSHHRRDGDPDASQPRKVHPSVVPAPPARAGAMASSRGSDSAADEEMQAPAKRDAPRARKDNAVRTSAPSSPTAEASVPCVHGYNVPNDDSWRTKPPRTHGFQRPYHVLQIVAWVVTIIVLLLAFVTTTRAIDMYDSEEDSNSHIPMHIAFGIMCMAALTFGIAASAIDPTDNGEMGQEVFCSSCMRTVHRTTKHCKVCNRCALHFDHHCKWLNNCVGKKNYFFFYAYVATLLLVIAFGATSTIYMLVKYWGDAAIAEKVFAILTLVLYVLASLPLLHLCGLHVMLMCRGITTYQYLTGATY